MNDVLNGLFELGGAILLLLNCRRLYLDKVVKGLSVIPLVYFTAWGVWNLYYYPSVGCPWSFYGGLALVIVNFTYLSMLWWYLRKERLCRSTPVK
jgi:hypothetical protein